MAGNYTLAVSEADDLCEACKKHVANRECPHGILCDECDKQVHGELNGLCQLEEQP